MKLLFLYDQKNGHQSQALGVMQAFLKEGNFISTTYQLQHSIFNYLPVFLARKGWLLNDKIIKKVNFYVKEKIEVIIAVGKRTLNLALYMKNYLQKQGINVLIFYLMPPGMNKLKYIDYSFYHSYKEVKNNSKLIPIILPPNNFVKEECKLYKNTQKPILGLLIGGNAKDIIFNKAAAKNLYNYSKKIQEKISGTILVSTSRRTPVAMEKYLERLFLNLPNVIFYGYHKNRGEDNPYMEILNCCDNIIVTGESTSMIAEAVALDNNKGVYIFFDKSFKSKRYIKLHHILYQKNYAFPLKDFSDNNKRKSYNSTEFIKDKIIELATNLT